MSDIILEADGLSKNYDGVRALDAVGLTLQRGDLFALVGPNGAGKTALLRLLNGILEPDSGTLRLFGGPRTTAAMDRIGYMPEERGLYKGISPLESVAYFGKLKGLPSREARPAAAEALELVGMLGHGKRKLEELSKGMSQRVQFAATLVHRPDLLILDEPFSGLDPVSTRDVMRVIQGQRDAGRTILLSTHNMSHAELLCNRMLMLHRGRARLYGSIAEIKSRYTDDSVIVEFDGELPILPDARAERTGPSTARLYPEPGAARRDILRDLVDAGADIRRFEPVVPSLEDIFVQVAGAEGEEALRATRDAALSFVT